MTHQTATRSMNASSTVRPTLAGAWPCVVAEGCTFQGNIALGNGTMWKFALQLNHARLSVKIISPCRLSKAHVWSGWAELTAVERAYKVPLVDAANICDFINRQLGNNSRPLGVYIKACCTRGVISMSDTPCPHASLVDALQNVPDHKLLLEAMRSYRQLLAAIEQNTEQDTGLHMQNEALQDMCEDILRTTACMTIFCQRYFANPAHQAEADLAAQQN